MSERISCGQSFGHSYLWVEWNFKQSKGKWTCHAAVTGINDKTRQSMSNRAKSKSSVTAAKCKKC